MDTVGYGRLRLMAGYCVKFGGTLSLRKVSDWYFLDVFGLVSTVSGCGFVLAWFSCSRLAFVFLSVFRVLTWLSCSYLAFVLSPGFHVLTWLAGAARSFHINIYSFFSFYIKFFFKTFFVHSCASPSKEISVDDTDEQSQICVGVSIFLSFQVCVALRNCIFL